MKIFCSILFFITFFITNAQNNKTYYSLQEALSSPEKVYKLQLFGKDIEADIKDIGQLKNLEYLIIEKCNFKNLPKSIGELKELKNIILIDNKLTSLPNSLSLLTKLEGLNLSENKITEFPSVINKLPKLKYLDLSKNNISNVKVLESLSLRNLNISKNKLTGFEADLSQCSNLSHIYLNNNSLPYFPKSLLQVKYLSHLNLSTNKITSVPEDIYRLKNLYKLRIANNQLTEIPETIGKMKSLAELAVNGNKLFTLPKSLEDMEYLYSLSVGSNFLTEINLDFSERRGFQYFEAPNNYINKWPSGILKAPNMKKIDLSNNKIDSIPITFSDTLSLWSLSLEGNPIKNITALIPLLKRERFNLDLNDDQYIPILKKLPEDRTLPPRKKLTKYLKKVEKHLIKQYGKENFEKYFTPNYTWFSAVEETKYGKNVNDIWCKPFSKSWENIFFYFSIGAKELSTSSYINIIMDNRGNIVPRMREYGYSYKYATGNLSTVITSPLKTINEVLEVNKQINQTKIKSKSLEWIKDEGSKTKGKLAYIVKEKYWKYILDPLTGELIKKEDNCDCISTEVSVYHEFYKQENKIGIREERKDKKIIVPAVYDSLNSEYGTIIAKKGDLYDLIFLDYLKMKPFVGFSNIQILLPFTRECCFGRLFLVDKAGKKGVIKHDGTIIMPQKFDEIIFEESTNIIKGYKKGKLKKSIPLEVD